MANDTVCKDLVGVILRKLQAGYAEAASALREYKGALIACCCAAACAVDSGGRVTWHHPLNTSREVSRDLAECAVQAAQAQYVLPNVFSLCMTGKGYSITDSNAETASTDVAIR